MGEPMPHRGANPLGLLPADLAPGDVRSCEMDWQGFTVVPVVSPTDPRFAVAYDALWHAFGVAGEMETRDVLAERLAWSPAAPQAGHALQYGLVAVFCRGVLAAVRDHTAVVDLNDASAPVVVHLSHLFLTPRWRGSGLGGWLRALPIRTARECLARAGQTTRPINLVAEMEPADLRLPNRFRRLTVYERVGFKKLDPRQIDYQQPDFRPPAVIDADSRLRPVPLSLVTRRVAREADDSLPAVEARAMIAALYHVYGRTFRPQDMTPLWERLHHLPTTGTVDLVPPTKT